MRIAHHNNKAAAIFRYHCLAGEVPKRQCRQCRQWKHAYRFPDCGGLRDLLCATCRKAVDGGYVDQRNAVERDILSRMRKHQASLMVAFFLHAKKGTAETLNIQAARYYRESGGLLGWPVNTARRAAALT